MESLWPAGSTAKKLFVVALVGLFYLWLVYASPLMMFFWSSVRYYVYPYVDYAWILDFIVLFIISLTTLRVTGHIGFLEADRFFRNLHQVRDTVCRHGYMDGDVCPSCSPPAGEVTITR